jgi:carbonic anhydrase
MSTTIVLQSTWHVLTNWKFLLIVRSVPQSVRDDVEFLRKHPWVRAETRVMGFLYETDTGKLRRVDDGASDGGRDI